MKIDSGHNAQGASLQPNDIDYEGFERENFEQEKLVREMHNSLTHDKTINEENTLENPKL